MYTAVVQGQYLQTIPTGPAGDNDDKVEASSAVEGVRDSGSEADAESGPEAASVEEDALPDGDDEPAPEAREPGVQDTPSGGAGPEVDPAVKDGYWGLPDPPNGYFIDELEVPIGEFRIPPKEIEEMLPQQLLMLQVSERALADAVTDTIDRELPLSEATEAHRAIEGRLTKGRLLLRIR